jgi:hypothetical protein
MNTIEVLLPANRIWQVLSMSTHRSGAPAYVGNAVAAMRTRSSALPGAISARLTVMPNKERIAQSC